MSAYREEAFPGVGDDGLGWDFQVPTRQGLLMYEVKASQGEGGQIELGETQVLAAQKHARGRSDRWRQLLSDYSFEQDSVVAVGSIGGPAQRHPRHT